MEKTLKTPPNTEEVWKNVKRILQPLFEQKLKKMLREKLRAKMIRGDFGPESQKKAILLKQERDAAMIEKRDSTLH